MHVRALHYICSHKSNPFVCMHVSALHTSDYLSIKGILTERLRRIKISKGWLPLKYGHKIGWGVIVECWDEAWNQRLGYYEFEMQQQIY